jgi:predicted enzyme related to lactoylglutathione lyase
MLRLGLTVLGVNDMSRAIAFWTRALDFQVTEGGPDARWTELGQAGRPVLALQRSQTPVQSHPRVHIDLDADDAAEQERQIQRLVALGAERVDWDNYPEGPDFVVLADTEGNRFCVVDTSH